MISGVFVGLSTIDLIYEVDKFPAPDSKITSRSQTVYAGGPATNAAITFRHLGGEAALVTSIGRHPLMALIWDELNRHHVKAVDVSPERPDMPAISAVAVDTTGQRNVISANASQISAYSEQVDLEMLNMASVLLVDGHLMKACIAWSRAAKDRGIPVVLDGGSWKRDTELLLPHIETAICSSDFLPPACSDHDQVIEFLRGHGIRQIAITGGSKPIRFTSNRGSGSIPVPAVSTVDTMGAGDIFHGAYSYFLAAGVGFPGALTQAASIASNSCRFRGTRAWMNQ